MIDTNSPVYLKVITELIDSNVYFSTLFEFESGRNHLAKNPGSSAKGGFQFITSTARALGLKDPFDLGESLIAVIKLTVENIKRFGDDPIALYSAHYLGATLFSKFLKGDQLTVTQKAQVEQLQNVLLPKFMTMYKRVYAKLANDR